MPDDIVFDGGSDADRREIVNALDAYLAANAAYDWQKLAEIRATKPVHVCFSFKVGNTPHKAAMRSMELMIGEVRPRVEKALGLLGQAAAE